MSDETPDTTGLREAVEALADEWETAHGNPPVDPSHISVRHAQRLRAILAAHPTPDASPDPAVVTPDADVEALILGTIVRWAGEAADLDDCREVTAALLPALANHVAAAREADRAEERERIAQAIEAATPPHRRGICYVGSPQSNHRESLLLAARIARHTPEDGA